MVRVEQRQPASKHIELEGRVRGFPSGRPSGNSPYSARGGFIRSTTSIIEANTTVARPAASKTWASVLTVRVHSGQTGREQHHVDGVGQQLGGARRAGVESQLRHGVGLIAGEREVARGDRPDRAVGSQLLESVDRVHDVHIDLEAGVIEVRAPVPEDQVAVVAVEGAIAGVALRERWVVWATQRRRRDDRHGALRQWLAQRVKAGSSNVRHR